MQWCSVDTGCFVVRGWGAGVAFRFDFLCTLTSYAQGTTYVFPSLLCLFLESVPINWVIKPKTFLANVAS